MSSRDDHAPLGDDVIQLLQEARQRARSSSAPLGQQCAALARTRDGRTHPGLAVHVPGNPQLSVCAEQAAICAARAATAEPIDCIALWIAPNSPTRPTGSSRQIWLELAPHAPLIVQRGDAPPVRLLAGDSMPDAFVDFEPQG